MMDGGVLKLLFDAAPWDSLIAFEPNIPVRLGGTLELVFWKDVDVTTQIGRTVHIIDWRGVNPTGQFQVASPYDWDVADLYSTGQVTLLAVPEPSTSFMTLVTLLSFVGWRRVTFC